MQDAPVVHPLMMLLVRVNEPPRFSTPVSAPTIVMFLTAIEEPPSILIPVPHESTWLNMMAGDEVTPETSIPVPQSMMLQYQYIPAPFSIDIPVLYSLNSNPRRLDSAPTFLKVI